MKAAVILLALVCAGCHSRTEDHDIKRHDPVVYRDTATGCEYLSTGRTITLTPRLDAAGKHICIKQVMP